MTKAAVYYHFRAKTDILRALAESMIEQITGMIDVVATKRSRRERIDTFATGYVDVLIGQRAIVAVVSDDPALHVRMAVEQEQFADLRQRLVAALYGEAPTHDERTAVYAVEGLAKAIPFLNDLDDNDAGLLGPGGLWHAELGSQVDDRDHLPTQVDHAADIHRRSRDGGDVHEADDFADFEDL